MYRGQTATCICPPGCFTTTFRGWELYSSLQTQKWVNNGRTLLSYFHLLSKTACWEISSLTSYFASHSYNRHVGCDGKCRTESRDDLQFSSNLPSPTTSSPSCITAASSRTVAAHWRDVLFCEQIRNVDYESRVALTICIKAQLTLRGNHLCNTQLVSTPTTNWSGKTSLCFCS